MFPICTAGTVLSFQLSFESSQHRVLSDIFSSSVAMLSFAASIPPSMTSSVSPPPPTNKARPVCVKPIMTQPDLNLALGVRRRVFVEEMGIPATEEFDAFDAWPLPNGVTHFLVTVDQQAIATCRINCTTSHGSKLERMAVDRLARRKGVGRALLRHIEKSKAVEESRGPFFCYAMKDKELFYRDCGWIVEEGHDVIEDAGIPHVAMVLRRRPRGSPMLDSLTLSHVMVRTWDISRARRFYSLLGYQDVTRFKTNGLKAVWIKVCSRLLLLALTVLLSITSEARNAMLTDRFSSFSSSELSSGT